MSGWRDAPERVLNLGDDRVDSAGDHGAENTSASVDAADCLAPAGRAVAVGEMADGPEASNQRAGDEHVELLKCCVGLEGIELRVLGKLKMVVEMQGRWTGGLPFYAAEADRRLNCNGDQDSDQGGTIETYVGYSYASFASTRRTVVKPFKRPPAKRYWP